MSRLYCDGPESSYLTLCETDTAAIGARLIEHGVRYEQFELPAVAIDPDAQSDEVVSCYLEALNAVARIMPYESLAVFSIAPSHPRLDALQRELMVEHAHGSAEAQLLVAGGGNLYIRVDSAVFALVCEPGDFVCLPPYLCHWFEMDYRRGVRTIRLFESGARMAAIRRGRDMRHAYLLQASRSGERV